MCKILIGVQVRQNSLALLGLINTAKGLLKLAVDREPRATLLDS
jgi:hypothetical protein